jgi:hypothetical protein
LTGDEKLDSEGTGSCSSDCSTGIAELLLRTSRAARLKRCNLEFSLAGAGNCSTGLSTGIAELLTSAGAGSCSSDWSTGIAELLTRITRAARLKRCNLKFGLF